MKVPSQQHLTLESPHQPLILSLPLSFNLCQVLLALGSSQHALSEWLTAREDFILRDLSSKLVNLSLDGLGCSDEVFVAREDLVEFVLGKVKGVELLGVFREEPWLSQIVRHFINADI